MTEPQTFGKLVRNFFDPILEVVTLPYMDQKYGYWDENRKASPERCCFGARIEHAICGYGCCDYQDGKKAFHKHFIVFYDGGYLADYVIDQVLFLCGAAYKPFGRDKWHFPPKKVMENLYRIEHLSRQILRDFVEATYLISAPIESRDFRNELNRLRRKYLKKMWAYRYE